MSEQKRGNPELFYLKLAGNISMKAFGTFYKKAKAENLAIILYTDDKPVINRVLPMGVYSNLKKLPSAHVKQLDSV